MRASRPGAIEAFRTMANTLAKTAQAVADAVYGLDVRPSVHVARGTSYFSDRSLDTRRRTLFMHPLDVISTENRGDPSTEIEEAVGWIYDNARAKLDTLGARLDDMAERGNFLQEVRLQKWLAENGMHDELAKILEAEA